MTPKSTQKSNALLLALWGFCLFGFGVYVFELGRFIVPLSWALGWHLTALAFGNALLKGVGYESDGLPARLTWSWLLGLGTFGFVVFILFLLGFGQTGVLWALWGLAASTGLWGLWSVNKDDGFAGELPTHWFGFGLAGCLVILFAMSPPLFYDTAVYHLGLMEQMGLWEQTLHFPHSSFASMPLITEMAIAVPFWLSGDPVVFNVANSFGFLLLGAAVSTVARAHFPKADNAGLLLAVLACPIVIFVTTGGKPDWMTATAFAGALYFWIVLVQHPESSHGPWLLLGLALGILIGSKYHGLLFAVIFCGAALSIADWRRVLLSKNITLTLFVTLFTGGLYYLRNWWVFDNPVYPFGGTLFGTSSWNERTALLYNGIAEKITNLEAVAALPWKMSFWVTDGTMNDLLGPLWLFLFPVAIIARPWPTTLQRFAVYVLLVTPLWAFSNAKVRYFAPLWLLLFWFCGWAWSYLKGQSIWVRAVSKITVGLLVGASLLWNLQADEALLVKRGTYLLGHQDKETYLKNHYGPYEAYRYCNTQLPENATILLMGEPRLAYLERRAIFSDVFVKPLHDVWLSDHSSPQTMKEALQEKGVTHLMVTRKGLQQLAGKWGFSRWTEAQRLHWSEFLSEATELLYEKNNWQVFKIKTN